MIRIGERDAVISGVGQSTIGRRLGRSGVDLSVEAVTRAVDHAGLTLADIDGVSTWPGYQPNSMGMAPVGVRDVKEALGLEVDWFCGGSETPGQFGAVFNAVAAVAAGFARHVVCFRTVTEATSIAAARNSPNPAGAVDRARVPAGSLLHWQMPFDARSAANILGMVANLHMHTYGTTRAQLGQIACTLREHAARNPKAVYRTPLTMDDYLSARMISTPFGLYDCDVPVDASTAVVISAAGCAGDLRRPPVRVEAIGSALHGRDSWDQRADLTTMAATDAARMLWRRTDLKPSDLDLATLYDGFSFLPLAWLEALAICGPGESGPFVEDGRNISFGGTLPLNPHGGQLSEGRTHGFGHLHEACLQLWGEAGDRQVPGARVAVAAAGGGPLAGCILLTSG